MGKKTTKSDKTDTKKMGRPLKDFDVKAFQDLVGLGCSQEEICWFFRDDNGKCANIDTLTRWCKRTFGQTFQEYFAENGCMALKIRLRRNQFRLSEKSAAMAIWLGKQYLGQADRIEQTITEIEDLSPLAAMLNVPNEEENAND